MFLIHQVQAKDGKLNIQQYLAQTTTNSHSCSNGAEINVMIAPKYLIFVISDSQLHPVGFPVTRLILPLPEEKSATYSLIGLVEVTDSESYPLYSAWFKDDDMWQRQDPDGSVSAEIDTQFSE